jgi:hypothetical protein
VAKIIVINIDEKGNQTAEANGVIGKGCEGVQRGLVSRCMNGCTRRTL